MFRPRHHVGHDILLARHGNSICSTRYDRRTNSVVALLDDGRVDRAPNLIAGQDAAPTIASVFREDHGFLTKLTAGYAAASLALCALIAGAVVNSGQAAEIAELYLAASLDPR